ncbi:MAG: glycosyltransferase family 2 protein [Bryobacter sp.]|jgi:glycosyltransferase involved in cell wall biosynthesis|nr:glycosyltransferase family 2 protein [Bryobacter sp. CoA8 C33]
MWHGKKVAVIFPTYNEKDSIRAAVLGYFATGLADEIIVVNNNAAPGTSEEVAGTGAREIFEIRQGYGNALLSGIDHCDADLIVLSEPDGTFNPNDLVKLLAYSDDVPVVFGTRTSREFIWAGANMGRFLRWGNWAVAKMTELLFNTTILTDMGCTLRLFDTAAIRRIRPHLTIGGSHFGPQLLMEVVAHGIPFVEIPVNYKSRVGESSVTGSFWKAWLLGWQMIFLVWKYRLGLVKRDRTPWRPEEGRSPEQRELTVNDPSLINLVRAVGLKQSEAPTQTAKRLG